jgi:enamine deaminase RidA (YjgF/YER057c/UK114 family)
MSCRAIRSAGPIVPIHQSEAVVAGPFVFTSGQMATDWTNGIAPEARTNPEFPYFASAVGKQTDYILRALSRTLQAAGSGLDHVVKAHVFLADCADFLGFDRVWNLYFPQPPTRTTVGAAGLLIPGARLEIAVIAIVPGKGAEKRTAHSDAPRPMTKKVEAVVAGDFVFTSGQLAHNARDGVPREASGPDGTPDLRKQTRYTLQNLNRSLNAAGTSAEQVIKTQALLLNASDYADFEVAWAGEFKAKPPCSPIGVRSLLVGGTLIEIDLTAYRGSDPPQFFPLEQSDGAAAVSCGGFVFTGGILPGPKGGEVPPSLVPHSAYPHYSSAIQLQTEEVIDRLRTTLETAGSSLDSVVKAQVFLTELEDFEVFDQVWRRHFTTPPARSVVKASGLPVKGGKIAIEVVAVNRS